MTDSKQDSSGSHNNLIAVSNSEHVSITIQPSSASQPPPLSGKFDLSRLPTTDSALFGREDELALIDRAWQESGTNVLVLTAMGGAGKTALMQKWIDDEHWRGADAVYTWSFYSQGSSEDKQASAAEFFDNALAWFGHDGSPIRSEHDRGVKLAELVRRQRTLLLLDGLEPLQHPLGGPMNGELKDKGLVSLCLQLAANGNGLLLISSRQPVMELNGRPHHQQHELEPLNAAAGIALFRAAGIIGTDKELCAAVEAYNGHALSLSLLAKYLSEYENGDIRQQDGLRGLPEFPEETRDSRNFFKGMTAYERQLSGSADLQILFSLGLFDRPVSAEAMSCLRKEGILSLPSDDRVFRAACERLRKQGLLNTARPEQPQNLDTHPLVRQYFGKRLAELHPESWRQAHVRLYEHFKAAAKEMPATLEEMEPLFAAVRHGCAAGMHQQALDDVYWPRIQRTRDNYLCQKLGAVAADLAVLAHFFAVPWHTPAVGLTEKDKAWILRVADFNLRTLERRHESAKEIYTEKEINVDSILFINTAKQLLAEYHEENKASREERKGLMAALLGLIENQNNLIKQINQSVGSSMGDIHIYGGQFGAVGQKATASGNTFQQIINELSRLREEMMSQAKTPEQRTAAEDVAKAEEAARQQNEPAMRRYLQKAGQWALDCAQRIGADVATEYLKKTIAGM